MAKINYQFYNGEKEYTDGSVEWELKDLFENGEDVEAFIEQDSRWPVYYHLSPKRENILSWYPFKPDASVLEIGSGCGALTGLLCERAGEVTSVELTKDRAEVNFARNKDKDNLEIVVGNFKNIIFNKSYDYIILNGVLEYAGSFISAENPYKKFLEVVSSHLKEDGKILIAIENRLGLKYFNGTPEEHTGKLFLGLGGYRGEDSVRTFTKKELERLLTEVGLEYYNFFYPMPDYKFPKSLYTDETIAELNTRDINTNAYNGPRLNFLDEPALMGTLADEGLAAHFANSFLVEASRKPFFDEVIYAKYNSDRKPAFQTLTMITESKDGRKRVVKRALKPEGKKHLDKMLRYYNGSQADGIYKKAPIRRAGEQYILDYIDGITKEDEIRALLEADDIEGYKKELEDFKEVLFADTEESDQYQTPEFIEVFGETENPPKLKLKPNSNFDYIFQNILTKEGQGYLIDYEWIFDFPIPQEFVAFRAIHDLYYKGLLSEDLYDESLDILGINKEDIPVFKDWADHFLSQYVTGSEEKQYLKPTVHMHEPMERALKDTGTPSSIYLNFGQGYGENNRVISDLKLKDNLFEVEFDLTEALERNEGRIKEMRWDPFENTGKLRDLKIETDGGDVELYPFVEDRGDRLYYNDFLYLLEEDPSIDILGDYEGLKKIKITGEIRGLGYGELTEIMRDLKGREVEHLKKLKEYRTVITDKDCHIENITNVIKELQAAIEVLQAAVAQK